MAAQLGWGYPDGCVVRILEFALGHLNINQPLAVLL